MRFQCEKCGGIVAVENSDAGILVQCGHCSAVVKAPASRVAPGSVIGDFIIRQEIGKGGMGTVYLSHQITLDRPAALKILSDKLAGNSEFVVGFVKEARAAAKLNHPHIVQAYAVGEDEGIFYFAMEYIEGDTMKHVLAREGRIPVDQALSIIQQIAEALDYAWKEEKLIHRDIKPDNIMLASGGRAKLADLGLARRASDKDDGDKDEIMGTPQYISPEHLTGAPMDVRSDIYSLGATFYHFVTGKFPFDGASGAEIANKHLSEPLIPPSVVNPEVSESVSRIIEKMMAKNPVMRYQDAATLVEDIRQVRKNKESGGRKIGLKTISLKNVQPSSGTQVNPSPSIHFSTGGEGQGGSTQTFGTSVNVRIRKARGRKKDNTQLYVLGGIAAVVVLGLVLFFALRSSDDDAKKEDAKQQTAAQKAEQKKPKYTPAQQEMMDILSAAKKGFIGGNVDMVSYDKLEVYLANHPDPDDYADYNERSTYGELASFFTTLDEVLNKKAYKDAEAKHVTLIAETRREQELKRRAEEERQAEERRQEEEKAYLEKMAERRTQETAKTVEETAKKTVSLRKKLCSQIITFGLLGDFKTVDSNIDFAKQEFEGLNNDSTPGIEDVTSPFLAWCDGMKENVSAVIKLRHEIYDGGKRYAGTRINYKGDIYVLKNISGKRIGFVQDGGSEIEVVPYSDLPYRIRMALFTRIATENALLDKLPFFLLLEGDFAGALRRAGDGRDAISELITNYLTDKLMNGNVAEKRMINAKYSKLKEFKDAQAAVETAAAAAEEETGAGAASESEASSEESSDGEEDEDGDEEE